MKLAAIAFAMLGGIAPSLAQHLPFAPLQGTPEKLGQVVFPVSCNADSQKHFTRGVALYHSFYRPEAKKVFDAAAQADPACAMGHAIVLMDNPFVWPLTGRALNEGVAAIERAKALAPKSQRERDYLAAAEAFYKDAEKIPAPARQLAYEPTLEKMTRDYPSDVEAKVFYSMVLSANFDPNDKTYSNQLRAAAHPGEIVPRASRSSRRCALFDPCYDYPPIAERGLQAAYRYRDIAPSAPHALQALGEGGQRPLTTIAQSTHACLLRFGDRRRPKLARNFLPQQPTNNQQAQAAVGPTGLVVQSGGKVRLW